MRGASSVAVVLRDLSVGGVPRVYVDLLGEMRRRGWRTRLVGGDGPLADEARTAGIEFLPVNWNELNAEPLAVADLISDFDSVVTVVAPEFVGAMLPLAAFARRSLVAIHCSASAFLSWFGPHSDAVVEVLRALLAGSSATLLTIGEWQRRSHAELFGTDGHVLPPAVRTDRFPYAVDAGARSRLVTVARLSVEKRWAIEAGINLMEHRLLKDPRARFDIVGDGPWRAEAETLCLRALPAGSFRFLGEQLEPGPPMRTAQLVLATGLAALEGVALGRPVVLGRPLGVDPDRPGPVLTATTLDQAGAAGFNGVVFGPMAASEVWAQADAMSDGDRSNLRKLVERDYSVKRAADSLESAIATLVPRAADRLLELTVRRVVDLTHSVARSDAQAARWQATADELWRRRSLVRKAGGWARRTLRH